MQWISINWKVIDKDLFGLYVRAKTAAKDSGYFQRLKRIMMRTLPLMVGFGTGFKLAFTGQS